MSALFCCGNAKPYRALRLQHESKFETFLSWAKFPKSSKRADDNASVDLAKLNVSFVVQLVRQVNYGPLESKRYFARVEGQGEEFVEVGEEDLIRANFQKLNAYKNFRCDSDNKFFEVNIYEKDPVNSHHWRINVARPGSNIDL